MLGSERGMRILVVEDDRGMANLLRQALEEDGHSVVLSFDGREALDVAQHYPFDVLVLDVMLPGLDGFAVARRLRAGRNQTPILILTARDQTSDIVQGLDLGADDYLTKPFSLEVLLARVRAVARRGPIPHPVRLVAGDLSMDLGTRQVHRGSRPVNLTRTEFAVLELLMRASGRVVTRETLLEQVWRSEDIESNTLDAFVRLLRAKIDTPNDVKLIRTVRGIGYCLRPED
jgi:two-component system copper resistance phosphate regulon response regulator CusR